MNQAAATPRALRTVITFIGRRNAGKSSLINAICAQDVAIVSDVAGTTTDAVAKPYELLPLGAVTFYDTAGLDDEGELGKERVRATKKVLYRSDVAVLVIGKDGLQEQDYQIINDVKQMKMPLTVVFNKTDIAKAKDGRTILYATNGKIKKVGNVQVGSLKIKGPGQNSNTDIKPQTPEKVNRKKSISENFLMISKFISFFGGIWFIIPQTDRKP